MAGLLLLHLLALWQRGAGLERFPIVITSCWCDLGRCARTQFGRYGPGRWGLRGKLRRLVHGHRWARRGVAHWFVRGGGAYP